ncbi:unnamed protein product [Discula destructiva]
MARSGDDDDDDDDDDSVKMDSTERTPLLASQNVIPAADPVASGSTTLQNSGLVTPADGDASNRQSDGDEDRPLPKWQIFFLCYARMVEPIAFFSIFPYINKMAQENGQLADADVGFYSGLIESLFSLTQVCVMVFWGKVADTVGRKPVLVLSLIGVSIVTSIFGMAKTLGQMILFRCLAGIFAGTIVVIRTMITELSTKRTQPVAFSWFAFSGNLGILFGPVLGGVLVDPAQQYPRLFGHIQFFVNYPYALPSFVIGAIGFSGAFVASFFVKETLDRGEFTTEDGVVKPRDESLSIMEIIKAPGVSMVLYIYCHIMLLAFAYTAISPVFLFTPVALGGFGLEPYQISIIMAVNGASQAFWLLVIFPPLQRRIGTNGVIRVCALAYPFFFMLMPFGNVLLRNNAVTAFWILAPTFMAIGCGVSMCFTAIQLALNDVAPSMKILGTLNSLALTGTSLMRSFSPALFTSLFALGARTQWLWGYAIWVLMVLMAVWFVVISAWLPEEEKAAVVEAAEPTDIDDPARQRERDG